VIFLPMHKTVMDAIRDGDAARAREAMVHLLTSTRNYMKEHISDA
jgi:DNA-binding FadR family transcriptional regulator